MKKSDSVNHGRRLASGDPRGKVRKTTDQSGHGPVVRGGGIVTSFCRTYSSPMANNRGGTVRYQMPEYFDFAFAMQEVPERDLMPPSSLILSKDIPLAADLRVTSLSDDDREAIRDAAAFRNKGCNEITLRPLLYAVVRDRTKNTEDTNGRLNLALALSRLVTPSTFGLDVWGRADRDVSGTLTRIEIQYGPLAYKGQKEKWWILPEEWEQVGALLRILDAKGPMSWMGLDAVFPKCVANAIRLFGHAAQHGNAQLRYLLLVPALEGMVVPKEGRISYTFKERLTRICGELRFPITENELKGIYKNRSHAAHGGLFRNTESHVLVHYQKLEGMLRAILTKAIKDPVFARAFENNGSLQSRWKVT